MQRWKWELESYLEEIFNVDIINGKKNIEDIMVVDKLTKSKMPIEDVPWWLETANVLKEDIVVIALKNIAEGVLPLTTDWTLLSSIYLLRKYTG